MSCKGWEKVRLGGIFHFNPAERLAKGAMAKKVAMDKLQLFTRSIGDYELAPYTGGAKFRNGDTLMARITPCLENGKTAWVSILDDNEVGFGSTEYIVLRAKDGVTDSRFVYYFSINPWFRDIAIKSMVARLVAKESSKMCSKILKFAFHPCTPNCVSPKF